MREKLFNTIWMLRAPILGVLVVTVVVSVVLALKPTNEGQTVWVTTSEIAYGQNISKDDLTPVTVPAAVVVQGAVNFSENVTQNLKAAQVIPKGTIISETDFLGSTDSRNLPTGFSIVQLAIPETTASGVQIGDLLDIWGQTSDCIDTSCQLQILCSGAQVIDIRETSNSLTSNSQSQLVVGIPDESIGQVLAAASSGTINLVIKAP